MPRIARFVCPGVPHHVTQRGNRRGMVFFNDDDRRAYLRLLRDYSSRHAVEILAYCLMDNHVHLVVVPATKQALHRALRPLHMRHAQRINRERGWSGHLWQGRYFSSALDDDYCWAAIRYVERNPVRAGVIDRAQDYPWSSAAAHCSRRPDGVLTTNPYWQRRLAVMDDWPAWLGDSDEPDHLAALRVNLRKGLPCGSEDFLETQRRATGTALVVRPRGRPTASHLDR